MAISDELTRQQFIQRENEIYHPTYDEELAFYDMIKNGNIEALDKKNDWASVVMPSRGILSKNPLRNYKYHLIVSLAMITRFCIEGGLNEKEAYTLSDIYINKIDEAKDPHTLMTLHKNFSYDFTKRMRKRNHITNHSVHCQKAMDYISNHLHEIIRVKDIADSVNLNVTYISKLFIKETGITISDYIRLQKINSAKNMLMYSDYSCADIAQYFAFASNSHFTQTFKKYVGVTPLQFRNQNYRSHFSQQI